MIFVQRVVNLISCRTCTYTLLKIFKGADFQNHVFINILGEILSDCSHIWLIHFAGYGSCSNKK